MEAVFLKLFNMSIAASFMILAIVVLRVFLKKLPKAIRPVLWALVGLRLICPFSLESALSLIPSAQTIPDAVLSEPSFSVQTGFAGVDTRVNAELADRYFEGVTVPTNTGLHITQLFAVIWLLGILAMAIYAIVSFVKLRRQTEESIQYADNIYLCDRIPAPFILGVFKPHIFLPSSMEEADMPYVLAHEKAHLKRRDHLWKPLGFALLSVYWFNPLIWVAYILLCRDIELACDEKVVKVMGAECKKPYAEALIRCSISQKRISACPVAFGETDVKNRIKSVLHYKKPAFWVCITAVLACIAVAVCFLTVPKGILLTELGQISDKPQSVTVITQGETYEIPDRHIDAVRNFMNEIYVDRTPITRSRSEERDKTNTVIFHFDSGDICYHFNGDCTELWVDDTIKPSYTHRVKDPQAVRQFLQEYLWNADSVPSSGVFLEITEADFSGAKPYMEIKWVNPSEKDLMFGEDFSISRITENSWEPYSFPENYGFNAIGILLPANSFRVQRYNLGVLDITQPGTYLFESECTDNDSEIAAEERLDYPVRLAFQLAENADGKLVCTNVTGDPYADRTYVFHNSADWSEPKFTLSQHTNQFQFTYSAFSSYWPHGTYDLTDSTLTLRTDDGENVYVFHAQGSDFVFDAAQSSPIPQYKYSADADEMQSPVPDGAVFTLLE